MNIKIKLETPGKSLQYWMIQTMASTEISRTSHHKGGNTMEQFLKRHKDSITGVLSCFDRVLFRGTLRSISHVEGMKAFLATHKVLLKDFEVFVQKHSTLSHYIKRTSYYDYIFNL